MSGKGLLMVVAAGGTGGHLFPAQALSAELIARGHRVVLMTDPRGRNYAETFPKAEIVTVPSATFADRGFLGKIGAFASLARGAMTAYGQLGRLKPDAVVGFGGYPSLPTMVAATQRRMKTLIHEQNAILGRVNRFVAGRVSAIAASFPKTERVPGAAQARIVITGNPIRAPLAALAGTPYTGPGSSGPLRLLVFGGSQGARVLSQTVPAALGLLPAPLKERLSIEQQCRPEDLEGARTQYAALGLKADLAPFFHDMGERLSRAHLVISRAGASTVAELLAVGRPAILIPYPFAMDDHQRANAAILGAQGACAPMLEKELTAQALSSLISDLAGEPERLMRMAAAARTLGRPGATAKLADAAEALAQGRPIAPVAESPS